MRGFTTGEVEVELDGGTVLISVKREISDRFNLSDSTFVILKRIPAHLNLAFNDVLLPIRFIIQNQFQFEQFSFGVSAYNSGKTIPVFLDGRKNLDGTWTLSQMLRGIILQSVAFECSFTEHRTASLPSLSFSPMPVKNNPSSTLGTFSTFLANENDNRLFHVYAAFEAGFQQPQGISGTITIDSMYELDGEVLLDGSRKLNANIIKEDI